MFELNFILDFLSSPYHSFTFINPPSCERIVFLEI